MPRLRAVRCAGRRAYNVHSATGFTLCQSRVCAIAQQPMRTQPRLVRTRRHDFGRASSADYQQPLKLRASKEWRPPRWLGADVHFTDRCGQAFFIWFSRHRSPPINREACNPKLGVCSQLAVRLLDGGIDRRSVVFLVCAGASAARDFNHDCHGVHSRRQS